MNKKLIDRAIETLVAVTGIKAQWVKDPKATAPNGTLRLMYHNSTYSFSLLVKSQPRNVHMPQIYGLASKYGNLLVVADTIYPNIAAQLKQYGICYIDTNGNIFLKNSGIYILIESKEPVKPKPTKPGRAFGKAGLTFIYHLLTHQSFLGKTLREKADICGTSVGNIHYIQNDLLNQNLLKVKKKGEYFIPDRQRLIDEWVSYYGTKLKPDSFVGAFRFKEKDWDAVKLDPTHERWGGEPAAYLITGYLKPEAFTIYSTRTRAELIRSYNLIPDEKGQVSVYNRFWKGWSNEESTVHPLLVYADLILTGHPRTVELAKMIFDGFLKE